MKRIVFTLVLLACAAGAYARNPVHGTVKTANEQKPVAFATVVLMTGDSAVAAGINTDSNGAFRMENVPDGSYLLQVSFLGYETIRRTVSLPEQEAVGEILLVESPIRLKEVVVTATRPFVTMKNDRYVVDVSGHIVSAGRSALELLRNTPGVVVSGGDDVSVLGSAVQVWVDGRPSRLSGSDLAKMLSSTSAESIDRIEVITNPSARYDAQGVGGIIDLRTKKGLEYGLNGSWGLNYRQNRGDKVSGNLNLNYRNRKINAFGTYAPSRSNSGWQRITQLNKVHTDMGTIVYDQLTQARAVDPAYDQQYRVGLDYFVNAKNTFGVIVNGYVNGLNGRTDMDGRTLITPPQDGIARSESVGEMTRRSHSQQVNLNYQRLFSQSGQQLNVDVDYARFVTRNHQTTQNDYFDPEGMPVGNPEELRHHTPRTVELWSGKADYRQSLGEVQMETGVKFSVSETDNDLAYEIRNAGTWENDPNRSNRYIYNEQVHAGYVNLSRRFGKVMASVGLRGEYTGIEGKQVTTGQRNDNDYFGLFPNLSLNYTPNRTHTMGLSYNRRLDRPVYSQLNPFEIVLDAYSFVRGNPDLTPAYSHSVQFRYMYKQNIMAMLSYSRTTDRIVRVPVVEAGTNRYGTTYDNFGKSENIAATVNWISRPASFWRLNVMVQGGYSKESTSQTQNAFVNDGFMFVSQINNNFTLMPSLTAELSGQYHAGIRVGYMKIDPTGSVSVGVRKTFQNGKYSLSINANDIFYTSRDKGVSKYDNVEYRMNSDSDRRWVNIGFRHTFGSGKVKSARRHDTGIEDEKIRVE